MMTDVILSVCKMFDCKYSINLKTLNIILIYFEFLICLRDDVCIYGVLHLYKANYF